MPAWTTFIYPSKFWFVFRWNGEKAKEKIAQSTNCTVNNNYSKNVQQSIDCCAFLGLDDCANEHMHIYRLRDWPNQKNAHNTAIGNEGNTAGFTTSTCSWQFSQTVKFSVSRGTWHWNILLQAFASRFTVKGWQFQIRNFWLFNMWMRLRKRGYRALPILLQQIQEAEGRNVVSATSIT